MVDGVINAGDNFLELRSTIARTEITARTIST
jgi:hypothetical protein